MKRTPAALLGAAAALTLLVGCGSDDGAAATGSSETASEFPRSGDQTYFSPKDLTDDLAAGGIVCTEFTESTPLASDPGEEGALCRFPRSGELGTFFSVLTYPSQAARVENNPAFSGSFGDPGQTVQGGNWYVGCMSSSAGDACEQIQGVLGGTLGP